MIIGPDATLADVMVAAARQLGAAEIVDSAREARLLVAHATGLSQASLVADPDRKIASDAAAALAGLVQRRMTREPMSHLIGRRGFWTLELEVCGDVLDPRPDSETLVEAALDLFPDRDAAIRVLDLGTGSGCLLLAVLSERPKGWGVGVDLSTAALEVAARNAKRVGLDPSVQFVCGDWAAAFDGAFDLILCNPPYIAHAAIDALAPEVARFEPRLALDGGVRGLDAYRAIAPDMARLLSDDGAAVIEAGAGQVAEIVEIFAASGLAAEAVHADLGGIDRAAVFRIDKSLTIG